MSKKILLASLSLIFSLLLFEGVLNLISIPYSRPVTHIPDKDQGFLNLMFGSDYDELYEDYHAKGTKPHIIALGDSYTNGGNVQRKDSYPHILFELLGRKVPVTNMGLCESTSHESFVRLQSFYNEPSNLNEKHHFIILVGAADIFTEDWTIGSDAGVRYLESITKITMNGKLQEHGYTPKIFKLFNVAWNKLSGSSIDKKSFNPGFYNALKKCYLPQKQKSCLKKVWSENLQRFSDIQGVKQLITQTVFLNTKFSKEPNKEIISDLLDFVSYQPRSLQFMMLTHNIMSYAQLQSFYPVQEIKERLYQAYQKQKDYIDQSKLMPEAQNYSMIFKSLDHWIENREALNQRRLDNLKRMVELIRKHQDRVTFLTYPLPFTEANNALRKAAAQKKVPLVDMQKIFTPLLSKSNGFHHLIDDWEHCTPPGYLLMAREILKIIQLEN